MILIMEFDKILQLDKIVHGFYLGIGMKTRKPACVRIGRLEE